MPSNTQVERIVARAVKQEARRAGKPIVATLLLAGRRAQAVKRLSRGSMALGAMLAYRKRVEIAIDSDVHLLAEQEAGWGGSPNACFTSGLLGRIDSSGTFTLPRKDRDWRFEEEGESLAIALADHFGDPERLREKWHSLAQAATDANERGERDEAKRLGAEAKALRHRYADAERARMAVDERAKEESERDKAERATALAEREDRHRQANVAILQAQG